MAYVILVQRAMDVRILLRQGTQYALARGTVTAVRVILATLLAVTGFSTSEQSQPFARRGDMGSRPLVHVFGDAVRGTKHLSAWDRPQNSFVEVYSTEQVLSEFPSRPAGSPKLVPCLKPLPGASAGTLHVSQIGVLPAMRRRILPGQSIGTPIDHSTSLPSTSLCIKKLRREKLPLTVYYDNPDGWLMLAGDSEQEILKRLFAEVLLPLPGRNDLVGVIRAGAASVAKLLIHAAT